MSTSSSRRTLVIAAVIVLLAVTGVTLYFYRPSPKMPVPGTPSYEKYVEAFQVGVAALDVDLPHVAEKHLTTAVELFSEEPAGWANRGLVYLRTNRLDKATADLERAQRLAPASPAVERLLGLLEERRGHLTEAAAHLRSAIQREPQDVESIYRLAQIIDQEPTKESEAEFQKLMELILVKEPNNLLVLLDRLRIAIRRSDREAVGSTLARFKNLSTNFSKLAQSTLSELEKTLAGQLGPDAATEMLGFSNVLRGESGFNRNYVSLRPPDALSGSPVQSFLRLTPLRHAPAPPDSDLTFSPEPIPFAPGGQFDHVLSLWLTGKDKPAVFVANDRELREIGSALALGSMPVSVDGIVALDWNNDFRMDLLIAGKNGLRFYEQEADGKFTDVTAKTGLPADILQGAYYGAWAADIDLDGDLDLIVARRSGPPLLLRNNFDGTFTAQPIFPEADSVRAFAWVDLDNDGAPDAVLLDARGNLHVYANERSGQFRRWPTAVPNGRFLALTVADANDDGVLDIIALREDGALLRISDKNKRSSWEVEELGRWESFPADVQPGSARLLAADLDNNGVLDLIASTPTDSRVWLGAAEGKFQPLPGSIPMHVLAAVDLDGDGRIDLVGLDPQGKPLSFRSSGKKSYHWQDIRPRASQGKTEGDNRINSFGIGGDAELRTGTHVVKQPITSPVIHFGLGERRRSDVIRIQWPNGTFQVEFDTAIDSAVVAEQRLKGSCPFLFAWNGERFDFVTDFLWSTPLGMYIQAQDKGGFLQTTDWVRIRGDQLKPRDGIYELRVNANLWETHFFDHMALMVVDHPPGTEMFVDERFFMTPSSPTFRLTETPHPVALALDHLGKDATAEVRAVDGVYLDRCGRGAYQGITRDHWVEADLGDDAPKTGPLWLIAHGWVHPTDSSINFAMEQGKHEPPHALVLEVPDGKGGWKAGRDRLGFPAGKNKTMLIRLDGIEGEGVSRRFRLRTSMEIYWDALLYARGRDEAETVKQTLLPNYADLHFRGILEMTQANPSSPELPHYDRIISHGQFYRDLIGYHTRFGNVRELLEKIDDRYTILNAGDELTLRFAAPAPPQSGWKRDFVWVCDGWVKDGDLNTRFGKTVLPLPSHDLQSYNTPPGRLEDDPVYRRHPKDWQVYHTRYVTPEIYERGLRNFRRPTADSASRAP